MKRFISVLSILTLSLALCVCPSSRGEETTYYGNMHIFDAYKSYYLNSEIKKCSIRFTARENKTAVALRFWSTIGAGISPTYRIGLQPDDGSGKPDGSWLGSSGLRYQETTLNASSWNAITLGEDASMTAGKVYHIVAQWVSGAVDSSNFRSCGLSYPFNPFVPLDGENDPHWNFLDTGRVEGKSGWIVRNLTPIFILNFNDGSRYGNPYKAMGGPWMTNGIGEQFTVDSPITVSGVALYIKKVGTPAGYFVVYDVSDNQVIEKIPVPAEAVPTSFNWVEVPFSQNRVLMPGVTYQIYGYTTTGTSNRWVGKVSAAAAGHEGLTWRRTSDVYVSGNGENPPLGTTDPTTDFPFRFTLVTGPPTEHTLTISTTVGGTTDPAPDSHVYAEGTIVSVTAIPDSGYVLDHWELDGVDVGSANPTMVTMDTDHSLQASFSTAPVTQYTLTINPATGGVTSPEAGSYQYDEGTAVSVLATPDSGYEFDHWELDGVDVGTANPINVTMDTDHTLTPYFAVIPPAEGTLEVDTTPVKGEVFVDGVSWGMAPQSRTVPEETYTVSFGDFLGYVTPPSETATVVAGETTSVLGTYEPAAGTGILSVDTTPVKGEVFVGGESWDIAPQERRLPEGTYTVSFGDVAGYVTPSPQTATVVADTTTSVTGVYEEITTVATVVTTWEYPFEGTPRGIVEDPQSGVVWERHNCFFLDSMNNVAQLHPDTGGGRFNKWIIPTPDSGASYGISIMNLRRVFFTEPNANKIGELISGRNTFVEWTVPPSANGQSQPYGIVVVGGTVYFTDIGGDRVGQLSTGMNKFWMWSLISGRQPSGIVVYAGAIYFLEQDRIARLEGNTLTEWTVPTSFGSWSGYIVQSQEFLFVTSDSGNKIGRFDPSTNLFTEWTVPTSNGAPKDMWISPRDPSLRTYFVESGTGKIGLLDTSSGGTETTLNFTTITLDPISVEVTPVETKVTRTSVTVPPTTTKVDGVVNGPFIEWSLPVPPAGLEGLAPSTIRLFFTHNSGIIGRFQLVVNTISEWTLPETVNPQKLTPGDVEESVFFTELDNKIGRLDGKANTVTEWTLPSPNAKPFDIASSGGYIFFTEEGANKIARFDPATNTLTEWTVPTPDSGPRGIFVLDNGVVYFAEFAANKIGRLDTATNTFTEWTVPTESSGPSYVLYCPGRSRVVFTETYGNKIGFLYPSTNPVGLQPNTFQEWVIPTADSFPTNLIRPIGCVCDVYFTESNYNKIGRLAVYNWGGVINEWTIPTLKNAPPNVISSMYRSVVNIFFTEATTNKIAFFDPKLSPKSSYRVEATSTTVAPATAQVTPVVTTLTPQVQVVSYTWKTVIGLATDGFVEWDIPTAASQPLGNITTERGEFFTESGAHKIGRLYITWLEYGG